MCFTVSSSVYVVVVYHVVWQSHVKGPVDMVTNNDVSKDGTAHLQLNQIFPGEPQEDVE